jgi:hypothetical protein
LCRREDNHFKEERNKEDNFNRQKVAANLPSLSIHPQRIKTAGLCPAPYFFLLKEERNKEDNFCRQKVTANLLLPSVRPKGLKPQGFAPHPISFFLKKKETKKIAFAYRR